MNFIKKFLSLFIVAALILSSAGCLIDNKNPDSSPEALLPQDMTAVLAIDHSNEGQAKLFQEVFSRIPFLGLVEEAMKDFEYKELLNSPWKIVAGVRLPKDEAQLKKLIEDPNFEPGKNGFDIYVVGKFAQPELVKAFLDKRVTDDPTNFEFVGTEEDPIWKLKEAGGSIMIIRRGDLYFMAFTSEQRAEILKRMEEGGGFSESGNYQKNIKMLGDNLGYFYGDLTMLGGLLVDLMGEEGGNLDLEALQAIGSVWGSLAVDKNGLKFISKIYFGDDKDLVNRFYPEGKVSLIEKVPAEGVILYSENPNLGLYLESFFKALATGLQANSFGNQMDEGIEYGELILEEDSAGLFVDPVSREKGYQSVSVLDSPAAVVSDKLLGETPEAEFDVDSLLKSEDLYGDLLNQVGAIAGLSGEEVREIFDNPFAFAISDSGSYLPAITLYIQLEEGSIENAKTLVSGAAIYVDMVIEELNNELKKNKLDGIIKKEVKLVEGATLQRVYADIASLPEDSKAGFSAMLGVDVSTLKVEVYYGVLSDGVFVFALYPDFVDVYGKSPISEADYYKEMRASFGDIYGRSAMFFRMEPLLKMVDVYFELAKTMMGLDPDLDKDVLLEYELYTKIASTLSYIFTSDVKDVDGLKTAVSVKIQAVELSPELLQKREAIELEKKSAQEAMMKLYEEADGATMDSGLIQ